MPVINGKLHNQSGVALVLTMLLLILITVFSLGIYTFFTGESRASAADYFSNQSFYASMAGIEKMTNDVTKLYAYKTQPTAADFPIITSNPPSIPGYTLSEYTIGFNGSSSVKTISSGPYEGLVALVQPYKVHVTATGNSNKSEARLRRDFATNLIPLFQFGIFYDGDLEAHAGPNFNFGGRVHTNRDLYVTAGATTTFNSRVTVNGEVVRDVRKNGDPAVPPDWTGTVNILDSLGNPKALIGSGSGEGGSVIGGPGRPLTPPGSANPVWATYSVTKFGGNLLNYQTGAAPLRLPLQVSGNQTIELIRRGVVGDSTVLLESRYFYKPGLRISLSNSGDPVLGGGGCTFTSNLADPTRCVITTSVAPLAGWLKSSASHFKVEIVSNLGTSTDVTQEFLNYGITDDSPPPPPPLPCPPPPSPPPTDPKAILRLQRAGNFYSCLGSGSVTGTLATSPYPINFYDIREGEVEDALDTFAGLSGIMSALEINISNLNQWLACTGAYAAGCSGTSVPNNNGYVVYVSDRRGEKLGFVNGSYDYEDTIFRNDALDPGEDLAGDGVYASGEKPSPLDIQSNTANFFNDFLLKPDPRVTFRRCLRLVNGSTLSFPLTVASENPVYLKGNYNVNIKKPASVAGDAITILSNNWNDRNSYNETLGARVATATTVQAAFIAGNTMSVYASPEPSYNEPHSSGGVHNLPRFLEKWNNPTVFTYVGSLVNLYTSRQAIGQWKCCSTVYGPPTRNWSFDVGFLNPANLPPATPSITIVEMQRFRRDLYQELAP